MSLQAPAAQITEIRKKTALSLAKRARAHPCGPQSYPLSTRYPLLVLFLCTLDGLVVGPSLLRLPAGLVPASHALGLRVAALLAAQEAQNGSCRSCS